MKKLVVHLQYISFNNTLNNIIHNYDIHANTLK